MFLCLHIIVTDINSFVTIFLKKILNIQNFLGFCFNTKVDILIFKFICNEKSTRAQAIEVVPKNNFRHTLIYMHKDNH